MGLGLALAIKLFLIRPLDIVDDFNDPIEYIGMALAHYWEFESPPQYPPGTAIALQPSILLGIPYRVILELALLTASVVYVTCLAGNRKLSAAVLAPAALLVFFDPTVIESFNHILSDNVSLLSTLIALGVTYKCMTGETTERKRVFYFLAALSWGFTVVTRSLSELVFVFLAIGVGYQLVADFSSIGKIGRIAYLRMVIIPVLVIAMLFSVKALNLMAFNVWGLSRFDNSTYKEFYYSLQRVIGDRGIRHFSVDEERRMLIYSISPSFRRYKEQIERRESIGFKSGREVYGINDIPNGWIHWHLWQVIPGSSQEKLKWMDAVSAEVSTACSAGSVNCRSFVFPGPDARTDVWTPHLLDSLGAVFSASFAIVRVEKSSPDRFRNVSFDLGTARKSAEYMLSLQRKPWTFRIFDFLGQFYEVLYLKIFKPLFFPMIVICLALASAGWFLIPGNVNKSLLGESIEGLGFGLTFFFLNLLFYVLLDAAGWRVEKRYLITNHVLIPFILFQIILCFVRLATCVPKRCRAEDSGLS
jgi:hypothetical protein